MRWYYAYRLSCFKRAHTDLLCLHLSNCGKFTFHKTNTTNPKNSYTVNWHTLIYCCYFFFARRLKVSNYSSVSFVTENVCIQTAYNIVAMYYELWYYYDNFKYYILLFLIRINREPLLNLRHQDGDSFHWTVSCTAKFYLF